MEKRKTAKSQIKASDRYNRLHKTRVFISLNNNYDKDIIEFLSTKGNKQGYIKELIRKDIKST